VDRDAHRADGPGLHRRGGAHRRDARADPPPDLVGREVKGASRATLHRLALMVSAAFLALAALALVTSGAREPTARPTLHERIPPGRESVVLGMVREAVGRESIGAISIDRDVVRVRTTAGEVFSVRRRAGPGGGGTPLADGVSLHCPSVCDPANISRSTPLALRLARSRDAHATEIWQAAAPPPRAPPRGPPLAGIWMFWRALFVALSVASLAQALLLRRDRRWPAGALAVLAAGTATLLVAHIPLLPAHDHNTFIARADCAIDPMCDRAPRGAWGVASLKVYGMFLGALPYRLLTLSVVSLAFTAVSAVLLVGLVRRLLERTPLADRAPLAGTLAGLFLACHPAFVRVAAADTPWPYAATCLLAAGLSALRAGERDARPWESWVALGWLGLAMTSNHVMLALAPLVVVAPWSFAQKPLRLRATTIPALIAWAFMIVPTAWVALGMLGHRAFDATPARLLYLDPRLTPMTWAALWALGLATICLRRMRVFTAVVCAWVLTQVPLAAQVPLETGYPTRFVHGFLGHYFDATFAAVGVAAVLGWVRDRRPAALAVVAAVTLLPWPLSRETVVFARERRPISLEARALSSAFERLPPHDVLVIPPDVQMDLDCVGPRSDPVEVAFPRGELDYVFRRRGLRAPRVVAVDRLTDADLPPGATALFYLGSVYRTFLRCEMQERRVPASLERPALARARARYDLAPVMTFEVPTAQHSFAAMRVMADRAPSVTLGFYWLRPRPATDPRTL